MLSIEQLMKEVLSLPSESRAFLAQKLVESLEFDINPIVESVWTVEAKRRREEIRSGTIEPIPGEEALAQVRRLLE